MNELETLNQLARKHTFVAASDGMNRTDADEIKALAAPLVAWIREKGNPHIEIRIANNYVATTQNVIGIPFDYSNE